MPRIKSSNDLSKDFGDFFEYSEGGSDTDSADFDELAENLARYRKGWYYPICLGEVLDERYQIQHELGHGGFSTVWMAHDSVDRIDVALKIVEPGRTGDRELDNHKTITESGVNTSYLLTLLRSFSLEAPHGTHRVLVFPLVGPSLRADISLLEQKKARMSIAKQLLEGLKSLHDAGIVHRDLNLANIMFKLQPIDYTLPHTEKYAKYFGRPVKTQIPSPLGKENWKAGEIVAPMTPHKSIIDHRHVLLGDFGISIKSGTSVEYKLQGPCEFCAPERFHGKQPTFASDMWSYMIIFQELYSGCRIFRASDSGEAMAFLCMSFGSFPSSWKKNFASEDGTACRDKWYTPGAWPDPQKGFEEWFDGLRPDIDKEERSNILALLYKGFSHEPEDRFTAVELLQDPNFKALMKIYDI